MPALRDKWLFLLLIAIVAAPFCVGFPQVHDFDDESTLFLDTGVSAPLSKKWFAVKGNAQQGGLWPDKEIKYTYANDKARIALEGPLRSAMHSWHLAGLPADFKLTYVSGTSIPSDRSKYLIISLGTNSLRSTNGCPVNGKPTSLLSVNNNVGMGNAQANIAHEIGHMFGLLHEHQNPWFWGQNSASSPSAFKFNCKHLEDYAAALKKYGDCAMEGLCSEYSLAANAHFSASDFLPLHFGTQAKGGIMDPSDVDWKSIMLYPSRVGGKGPGSSRAMVLMRVDGETEKEILPNHTPSTQDVDGLKAIYGDC